MTHLDPEAFLAKIMADRIAEGLTVRCEHNGHTFYRHCATIKQRDEFMERAIRAGATVHIVLT